MYNTTDRQDPKTVTVEVSSCGSEQRNTTAQQRRCRLYLQMDYRTNRRSSGIRMFAKNGLFYIHSETSIDCFGVHRYSFPGGWGLKPRGSSKQLIFRCAQLVFQFVGEAVLAIGFV